MSYLNYRLLKIALSQYGIAEIKGDQHNPEVLKYFAETGNKWVQDDETAWCSAAWAWCNMKAGKEYSKKLNARSWLDIGIPTKKPRLMDTVILWRKSPESWKGHVGGFVRSNSKTIWVFGGNQSNQVKISAYPIKRLLGYRRMKRIS